MTQSFSTKIISQTPNLEDNIVYCARVSSKKQDAENADRLLNYLISNGHWSPFEMVNICVEVVTSRMISPQILRHRSFSFQEFSQRYSAVDECIIYEARLQDQKNRQNSIETNDKELQDWWERIQYTVWDFAQDCYQKALDKGIAKELARGVLPGISKTKLYMNGSLRSWIHYLEVRTDPTTQKEHREIANSIKNLFIEKYPIIAKALNWGSDVKSNI